MASPTAPAAMPSAGVDSPHNACCYRDECRALKIEKQGAIDRGLMMLNAKNEWRDRALAAEAALAGERERCARVVEDWAEEHAAGLNEDAPSPLGRHRVAMNDGYALAAAIRAQGE